MMSPTHDTDRLLAVARAYAPRPSRRAGLYCASDLTGFAQTFQLDGPGQWPVRLAPSQERTLPVGETAHGLLLRHDIGGGEIWQLSLLTRDGGLRPLTTDPSAIHHSVRISPDGLHAGLAYNPEGQADFALAELDLGSGRLERLAEFDGFWSFGDWRPDGRQFSLTHELGVRNEAFLMEPGGHPQRALPDAPTVAQLTWSGGRLFALTDAGRDFIGLAELDADDPREPLRWLFREDHDLRAFVPDHEGGHALIVVNQGPHDSIRILDLASGVETERLHLPPGAVYTDNSSTPSDHLAWSPDDQTLFVAWESGTAPAEIYELPANRRWTFAAGGEPIPGLVSPEPASYPSFDGETIHALHYRVDDEPRPTVVWFHGGPAAQHRDLFFPPIAMLNAAGITVFAPNVRGSTGYGRAFMELDDLHLRWHSVKDGCEAARHLKNSQLATRLAAMGGSYGGFMTLAVLVEDAELWDAGVDIVGIADWHTFFENQKGWRRAQRTPEYGDPLAGDADFLAEFSPLRRADRITAPLLVIHGRNDVRVPLDEALQIAEAVSDSELLVFDDEGHGIMRHPNRVRAYRRALDFLRECFERPRAVAAEADPGGPPAATAEAQGEGEGEGEGEPAPSQVG